MNLPKIAHLSEIVSSIAIVVTLIYLTMEINQNTSALHAQSRQATLEASQEELFALMDQPEIVMSIIQSEPLTREQAVRLDLFLSAALKGREFSWFQYRDELIDGLAWKSEKASLYAILDSERTRLWWDRSGRHLYSAEFVVVVDQLLAAQPATNSIWTASAGWASTQADKD